AVRPESRDPPCVASQLSFAEVMRLVQEGKEVPGVTKVDVHASNQSPTPSQMERRQKPWETAPDQTALSKAPRTPYSWRTHHRTPRGTWLNAFSKSTKHIQTG
uniref:Peroxisomal membrane protein PEX14-like KPWE domain-containing protein n=1 Tax=Oryzias melastigma TaxID=30732 RepID=A0A3B3B8L9_ORYME